MKSFSIFIHLKVKLKMKLYDKMQMFKLILMIVFAFLNLSNLQLFLWLEKIHDIDSLYNNVQNMTFLKKTYQNLMNFIKKFKNMTKDNGNRNIRCQTLQFLKIQNNRRRRQSLPQDFSVTQEPQIQRVKALIKQRQSMSSTHESKLKLESQQQFQLSQQNQIQMPQIKIIQLDNIFEIFLNDSHHIPNSFGQTYLIKGNIDIDKDKDILKKYFMLLYD
ncbi:unnamed protein product [Paramecium sonneborni]|uniref:Uncharacterized protein n=1 Tax=Paramecium sonneborni TaxID=65129 RepID=A0A8S1NFL1_9CILI|nr:unnamed protein product [Paramecium sonneborni]